MAKAIFRVSRVRLRHLELGLGLLLVHRELSERLLQRPGLRRVELPLLLQILRPLLVLPEPERQKRNPERNPPPRTNRAFCDSDTQRTS